MATIIIDGVTQPGNTGEGQYPVFTIDSKKGILSISFSAASGTAGTWSGGQQQYALIEGDDAHLNEWRSVPWPDGYTPPANLPPA